MIYLFFTNKKKRAALKMFGPVTDDKLYCFILALRRDKLTKTAALGLVWLVSYRKTAKPYFLLIQKKKNFKY